MAQEWVYGAASAGGFPLRLNEASEELSIGQGDVLVEVCYIALPGGLSHEGREEGSVVTGPLVGTVKRSSSDSFAAGDWVFAYGPWRRELSTSAGNVVKIDTRLDNPLSYLGALKDEVVQLYAAVQFLQRSNQDAACVLGADTANGRIATALLKALGYSVLALTESEGGAATVTADKQADHVHRLDEKDVAAVLREVGIDRLKVCVDCHGGAIDDVCASMAPGGLIASWATSPSTLTSFASLANAHVTFKTIRPNASTPELHQTRNIVRDVFRKHATPDVVRIESDFEHLEAAYTNQKASEFVVVQVEQATPLDDKDAFHAESVELHRSLAEVEAALRFLISDTVLRNAINQRQVALRARLQEIDQARAAPKAQEATAAATVVADEEKADNVAAIAEKKTEVPVRVAPTPGARFIAIDKFAWDQGEYNSPTVTVYVDMPGVGAVKDSVSCHFERNSFDLTISGLEGKNYRLLKDNLEKEIIPAESRIIVKANKVLIKLKKVKGEFSFDHWSNLTAKRKRDAATPSKDPMGGIMDMMRDMYEEGDDQTRKLIGEAMMKAQRGEKDTPPSFDNL